MTRNVELMRSAKAALKGNWGIAALTTLVLVLILGASSFIAVGPLLIGGPLALGYILFLRSIRSKNESVKLESLFEGFNDFLRAFVAYLLVMIFIFLWMLLLIIPGLIMTIAYSMTFFILADDKEISAMDAIRKSRNMMRGYKWKYFCLQLRFLGWIILSIFTLGILLLWIQPYMEMANLQFYYDVKADREER